MFNLQQILSAIHLLPSGWNFTHPPPSKILTTVGIRGADSGPPLVALNLCCSRGLKTL